MYCLCEYNKSQCQAPNIRSKLGKSLYREPVIWARAQIDIYELANAKIAGFFRHRKFEYCVRWTCIHFHDKRPGLLNIFHIIYFGISCKFELVLKTLLHLGVNEQNPCFETKSASFLNATYLLQLANNFYCLTPARQVSYLTATFIDF